MISAVRQGTSLWLCVAAALILRLPSCRKLERKQRVLLAMGLVPTVVPAH